MSHPLDAANSDGKLRQRAVSKLTSGTPTQPKRASQIEALAVLHQLASSPSTAGDALALLHELQVLQVELDLQQEELRSAQSELETALVRQTALVERAPAGFMTIDTGTVLREINLAGARLLGTARDDLLGRPLASLLSVASADALQLLLARARDDLAPETCELRLLPIAGTTRAVYATADKGSNPESFQLVLMAAAVPTPAT